MQFKSQAAFRSDASRPANPRFPRLPSPLSLSFPLSLALPFSRLSNLRKLRSRVTVAACIRLLRMRCAEIAPCEFANNPTLPDRSFIPRRLIGLLLGATLLVCIYITNRYRVAQYLRKEGNRARMRKILAFTKAWLRSDARHFTYTWIICEGCTCSISYKKTTRNLCKCSVRTSESQRYNHCHVKR